MLGILKRFVSTAILRTRKTSPPATADDAGNEDGADLRDIAQDPVRPETLDVGRPAENPIQRPSRPGNVDRGQDTFRAADVHVVPVQRSAQRPVVVIRPNIPRDCILCGEMICGCWWHRSQNSWESIYGLCKTDANDLSRLGGEVLMRQGDVIRIKRAMPGPTSRRIGASLLALQRGKEIR